MAPTGTAQYDDLRDKVVLITGGAAGIGAATARAFLAQGAKVAVVDVAQGALDDVVAELGAEPDRLIAITADVSKEDEVKRYVDTTVEKFGRIDVFFNNAGIGGPVKPIVEVDPAEFDQVIAINLRGCWLGLHFVLPVMYEQRSGSVINTSSIGGLVAGPMPVSPYVASKFGITGLTRLAAHESAPYGVRVNSVHPSPAATQMMTKTENLSGASREEISKSIPLGRYADADDIANLALFLGSEQSSFVTGSEHRVDGGMLS